MDTIWMCEFLFLCFQCFYISSMKVAGLVTTIPYPEQNILNISCWNTSQIQIQNIDIQEEETICRQKPCVLNSQDTQAIEDNCNGEQSCLVDYNFTTSCLREFKYVNLSYTCKHENGTSLSTFEDGYGDWMSDSSSSATWTRNTFLKDHTRVNLAKLGYSIHAYSYGGKSGTTRIDTDKEFMEPICLSLWYQFYNNAYDCIFSIYKIINEKKTLLFTVDGNFSFYNVWINTLVDVYEQNPFKIALEADFSQRSATATRVILLDDTSIAYRPCKGKQVLSTCRDLKKPMEIECETQYLVSMIEIFLEPENRISDLKNCPAESIKSGINSFCKNLSKTDKCKISVLNFTSGYEDCYVSSKKISVSFQCNNDPQTTRNVKISTETSTMPEVNFRTSTLSKISKESRTMIGDNFPTTPHVEISVESSTHFKANMTGGSLKSPVQYDFIAIAAGVGGGILLIIIVVVVIYRVRRSKTGKQETSPGNANKAYDENQYDYASQQHLTSSESSNQNTNKQNKSNSNTQKQVLIGQDGQQSADLYGMTDDGTYDVTSNNKPRENQNYNNVYSHTSGDGTYDVSSNNKHRENPNDNNLYSHWSGDGTYDVSSNNKKRENQIDDNIYSHKADDVYDSAGHHKLPDRSEETYDHFFGQQTEDEYDTTTRT